MHYLPSSVCDAERNFLSLPLHVLFPPQTHCTDCQRNEVPLCLETAGNLIRNPTFSRQETVHLSELQIAPLSLI